MVKKNDSSENLNYVLYYKKNKLHQLKGFYYTALLGSTKEAAIKLGVTQTSITNRIQSLQNFIGIQLFYRSKTLMLTEDGKELYDMVAPIMQSIDGIFDEYIDRKQKNKDSKISIAAHHIAISYMLPKYIKQLKDINPDVKIEIYNISRSEAITRLIDNKIDIAIYPNADIPSTCDYRELFSYDPILIMKKDHPLANKEDSDISLEDIAKYELIRIDASLITLPLFEEIVKTYKWKSNITFEMGNWEILKHFVREGLGIAIVSTLCINKQYDQDIVCKSMIHHFPKMNYSIVTKRGRIISKSANQFIDIIKEDSI